MQTLHWLDMEHSHPNAGSAFFFEQTRLAEARHLPWHCHDEFLRLTRTLLHGTDFQWVLIDAPNDGLRRMVMAVLDKALHQAGLRSNRLPLSQKILDVATLEERLVKNANQASVVHVIGRPDWFDEARWESLNIRRERLAAKARARLVFWMDEKAIALAARHAPDLWAWRSGVYAFQSDAIPDANRPELEELGNDQSCTIAERSRRVAYLRGWLELHPRAADELMITALNELGLLLFSLGDLDEALAHWRNVEIPYYRRLGDSRGEAIAMGFIADALRDRGDLDEALRIRKEMQMPIFYQLGDRRSLAIAIGKIADILEVRGDVNEALRIRRDEELPVYEELGDVRSKAIIMGKIADILRVRGQLDEALRIRKEEQLPVFERLGDVRSVATTLGKIADILRIRGQVDEALRTYRQDVLPLYERLGDGPGQAFTKRKIASLLQAGEACTPAASPPHPARIACSPTL